MIYRKGKGIVNQLHKVFVYSMAGASTVCLTYTAYYGVRFFILENFPHQIEFREKQKALEEADSLKRVNVDAQAETSQLKKHRITLTDKIKFLEKDAIDRDGFKKAVEGKIIKLEANVSKSNMTFKKYKARASTVEKVCLD